MAFVNLQTPLKNLKTGNYFYPLTNLNQIICTNNRLSTFIDEDNNNLLNLNNINNINGNNIIINGKVQITSSDSSSFLGALAEEQFNKIDIRTWCDTATNIHKSSYQGDMVLKRFFSQDEAATTYNLPCTDSHMMIFSIDGTSTNWTRILALDMRSPILFIGGKNSDTWQPWTQLITDNTAQTISGVKTFTSQPKLNSGFNWPTPANITCTIGDSGNEWSIDLSPGSTTGTYWHVWSGTNNASILQCFNDNRHVMIPVHLAVGGYNNTSYGLSTNSFICNSWVRTKGSTGWYSEDYGGGWYMSDNTWLRSYNNKAIYSGSGKIRTDGELWSKYIRIVDNWIGVYENIDNTTKRFGYMQIDRSNNGLFRFVKENGGNFYFNTLVRIDGDLHVGNNSTVGHIICGTYKDTAHGEHQIQVNSGAGRWYLYSQASATGTRGIYGHNNAGTGVSVLYMNQDNYLRAGTRLYGAVWNDYAEFRKGQMDNLKPGQIVTEVGNGNMKLANQRLQKGCKILSDTYGFALGETKECKLPIAVAGRVLVYCDTAKEELEPGDCLCANYTGNTIKMTQEEIIKYPDRIVGIVSEIPNYNIWHSLDPDNPDVLKEDIQVDGRIWVYVR